MRVFLLIFFFQMKLTFKSECSNDDDDDDVGKEARRRRRLFLLCGSSGVKRSNTRRIDLDAQIQIQPEINNDNRINIHFYSMRTANLTIAQSFNYLSNI